MSSMAKIFVVANLAFGIAAFGSAATLLGAQDDYRKGYEDEVAKRKALEVSSQQKIDELELAKSQQNNRASEEFGRATQLQQTVEDLNTRLAAAESANQTLRSSVDSFSKELAAQNQLIAANQEFLNKLSGETKTATEQMLNATARLDKEITNRVGLEQQVAELNEQMTTVSAQKGDLDRALREANFYLDKYRVKFGPLGPAEGSAGQVMAVKGQLVSISVGSADKVRPGDYYDISRGASYVGRVKITSVDRNLSVGQFDTNNPGSGAPPQPGDKATPGSGD